MNIFILNLDPQLAAQNQCDKHVVKMTLESAQLLCSPFELGAAPYKRTHYNHPCSIWIRESQQNYMWLVVHGKALAEECTLRYAKVHKSKQVIEWCEVNVGGLNLPNRGLTPFAQAMPDIYKNADPVIAYRTYYIQEKQRIAQWKNGREKPEWYNSNNQ